MKLRPVIVLTLCSLWFTPALVAEDLKAMEAEAAQLYGRHLSELFEKTKDHQVKIEPAISEASGLVLGHEGIVLVPARQLDDEELNKLVESETGAPLAYLFLSPRFNPLEAGKKIEPKKLRTVQYEADGEKRDATALILAVRHIEGSEWRLYVYGADKKPVIEAKFFEADDEQDQKLSVRVQDVKDGRGTLVVTVMKKYEASIDIAV